MNSAFSFITQASLPGERKTGGLRRFFILGLLSVGTAYSGAEPSPNGWRFNGYYFADGEEWFSLQDPTGGGEWFRKGGAGAVRVLQFDTKSGALTVLINSHTHVLTLAQGRIAPGGASAENSAADDRPAVPTVEVASITPAERFERLKIQALARQIEREETARERIPSFATATGASQGEARGDSTTAPTTSEPSSRATSNSETLSAEDWLAIHRRTAERRAVLEEKWAAEKLAWASGNSPARDPNPAR